MATMIQMRHGVVSVRKGMYENGNLALQLFCVKVDGAIPGEPYGTATVNLVHVPLPADGQAYLDTNNMPEIVDVLLAAEAGNLTGHSAQSGYCRYPLFKFKPEWLQEVAAGRS